MQDDRPKKSWREIDAAREKSAPRREPGAPDKSDRSAAYRAYKSQLGKLFDSKANAPKDTKNQEEELAKLLEGSDETVVLQALQALLALQGPLKRAASLKARLKTVQMTLDDPEIQAAVKALLVKL